MIMFPIKYLVNDWFEKMLSSRSGFKSSYMRSNMKTTEILVAAFEFEEKAALEFVEQSEKRGIALDVFLNNGVFSKGIVLSEEEERAIKDDLAILIKQQSKDCEAEAQPRYICSAGAPGTGKSYFLRNTPRILKNAMLGRSKRSWTKLSKWF